LRKESLTPSHPDQQVLPQDKGILLARKPALRFSPTAWAKLVFFGDFGNTEIGGFAITPPDDLLFIKDFITVKQNASFVSSSFNDEAVADYFEAQVDAGRKPEQFARIWLHTHPGMCPHPSETDEETFQRVFGHCEWTVMFILGRQGKTYARLRFSVGPGVEFEIPVRVDYRPPFSSSDHEAWKAEYKSNIIQKTSPQSFLFGDNIPTQQDFKHGRHSYLDDRAEDLQASEPLDCRITPEDGCADFDPWEYFQEDEPWD